MDRPLPFLRRHEPRVIVDRREGVLSRAEVVALIVTLRETLAKLEAMEQVE
jgi:hypothetical protein